MNPSQANNHGGFNQKIDNPGPDLPACYLVHFQMQYTGAIVAGSRGKRTGKGVRARALRRMRLRNLLFFWIEGADAKMSALHKA
jgi:hypothetical protein